MAVDGGLGALRAEALPGGELHAGADRAEVALFDELRTGEAQGEALEVGVPLAPRAVDHAQGGEGAAAGAALEAQGDPGPEAQGATAGGLEAGAQGVRFVIGGAEDVGPAGEDRRPGGLFFAGGRVEGELWAVDFHADVADLQRDAGEDVGDWV